MTTQTLPKQPEGPVSRAGRRTWYVFVTTMAIATRQLGLRARPTATHLRDHGYTIAGLTLIGAAAFVHSLFAGLLVTGILFLVLEWKVSD